MNSRNPGAGDERGLALVMSVLFLLLAGVLAIGLITSASSERSLSSNVHTAKGALYAADAGIRVTEQKLANMAALKMDTLTKNWSGGPMIPLPATFFPVGTISSSSTSPNFTATANVQWMDSTSTDSSQIYRYLVTMTSTGNESSTGQRKVLSQSILRVSTSRGSLTDYLMFIDTFTTPSGGAIWFTSNTNFDGRVHTNGEFRFAYKPTFQDLVTSANGKSWYNNNGSPKELAADYNGSVDVPKFYGGFTRGVATIPLPTNSFNQQSAALGLATTGSAPSNVEINTVLGTGNGTSPPPNGVYVVKTAGAVTGGIYVQGGLDQMLMNLDGSGNQVYSMKQGSTTTTITLKRSTGQTVVKVGSGVATTYPGLPLGVAYVMGGISDLRGPDRSSGNVVPALQQNNRLLIASTGDVVITRDIVNNDYSAKDGVLGILSSGGNVRVGTGAPNNLNIDADVMSCAPSGVFTVDNYNSGAPRGILHLRGCVVTKYYGAFGTFSSGGAQATGYGRDFSFDDRGVIPPYFPGGGTPVGNTPKSRTIVWKEI